MKHTPLSICIALFFSALGNPAQAGPPLTALGLGNEPYFTVSDNPLGTLYDVDLVSGIVSNPRVISGAAWLSGIRFSPHTGVLYALGYTIGGHQPALFTLDPWTGAATLVGLLGVGITYDGDLDYDPATDIWYGTSTMVPVGARQFYTIDIATGAATLVTTVKPCALPAAGPGGCCYVGPPGFCAWTTLQSMTFDTLGQLYFLHGAFNKLTRTSKVDGTALGEIALSGYPFDQVSQAGMKFVTGAPTTPYFVSGGCRGALPNYCSATQGTHKLYTMNIVTGVVKAIGDLRDARGALLDNGLSDLETYP